MNKGWTESENTDSEDTPKSLVSTIRDTLSAAHAKKSVTIATYSKLFTALDTLDLLLQSEDRVEASLKAFKADILAGLAAASPRSSTSSYASTAASSASSAPPAPRPPPPAAPKPPAAKSSEIVVLLDRGSDLLSRPLHEIKGKVEAALESSGGLNISTRREVSSRRTKLGNMIAAWRKQQKSITPRLGDKVSGQATASLVVPVEFERNLWLHVPNTCALVDETDQQEAMQALAENFEMTELFTIWKPEDKTSMQLFQI
ncbi:hypothetical protein B0H14DRAFT_2585096 [Mycena olivaceomarginata]|nr:hypothetical protein B0H14DRAFT_2585096 [Mycena olivaceomarginata]